jgi:mRNA-degrading endonuclease toxin of MazEF toxin-antitoxin module
VIQSGDIYRADLNAEVRIRVLVVSTERFHRFSGRSLVAPEVIGEAADAVSYPWRVQVDDAVFAVDLIRSVAIGNLLERLDRAPAKAMQNVRRTLLAIT